MRSAARRYPRAGILLSRVVSLSIVGLVSGCLESPSYEGRACDRFSPCPDNLVCGERLICERPDSAATPTIEPPGDASPSAPHSDGDLDAGSVSDVAVSDAGEKDSDAGGRDVSGDGTSRQDAGSAPPDAAATSSDSGPRDIGAPSGDGGGPPDAAQSADAGPPADAGCAIQVNAQGEYCTIQDAIDAAPSGATVSVPPGVFTERVIVVKPLVITGAGVGSMGSTVLYGPATTTAALEIQASNVDVGGFLIGGPSGGVSVSGAGTGIMLHDLVIDGSTGFGISVLESAVTLDGVSISGVTLGAGAGREGHGVRASSNAQVNVLASYVGGCAGDGIHLEEATGNIHAETGNRDTVIENNAGYGVFSAGSMASLLVKPNPNSQSNVGNVTIRGNARSAVHVAGGYARVADNTIGGDTGTLAPQHGVSFNGSGEYHAKRNVVSGASGYGLFCDPTGSGVACDSNDPNTLSGNALGGRSPACPSSCE